MQGILNLPKLIYQFSVDVIKIITIHSSFCWKLLQHNYSLWYQCWTVLLVFMSCHLFISEI